ncbi:MAG TPA: F0F1 ATP synthase subunit A [Armatimonadota bacterium]|nr:F0F1 ATP synthase subunit A [Armatimonadota bacterium]
MEKESPWVLLAMSGLVILGLSVFGFAATRRLERIPRTRFQSFVELLVSSLNNLAVDTIGPGAEKYTPFIGTVFVYILAANLLGLIPALKSPTSNLSLIAPVALIVLVTYTYYGIRKVGVLRYMKHLAGEPIWLAPLMLPVHLISELARPLSLSIRLFGNIFGEDTILLVLAGITYVVIPYVVAIPTQFPVIPLALLTAFVQALVFTILTTVYISLAVSQEGGH